MLFGFAGLTGRRPTEALLAHDRRRGRGPRQGGGPGPEVAPALAPARARRGSGHLDLRSARGAQRGVQPAPPRRVVRHLPRERLRRARRRPQPGPAERPAAGQLGAAERTRRRTRGAGGRRGAGSGLRAAAADIAPATGQPLLRGPLDGWRAAPRAPGPGHRAERDDRGPPRRPGAQGCATCRWRTPGARRCARPSRTRSARGYRATGVGAGASDGLPTRWYVLRRTGTSDG
jgi:hypothetical protein